MTQSIIIVGAGLSGLTLAYYLKNSVADITIIEASDRLGGRIHTVKGKLDTPLELGATWLSDMHSELITLLGELNLRKYPQFSGGISLFQTKSFEPSQQFYVPESEQPSYRIVGGSQAIIDTLAKEVSNSKIILNHSVISVIESGDKLSVLTDTGSQFKADKVVFCIPPQLASTISYSPSLPKAFQELLPGVQTWMMGAIKFVVEYKVPFWRNKGYSGMLYSHAGLIVEMYDHTNFEEEKFGFTGFLNGSAGIYDQQVRRELVIKQLVTLFGEEALPATDYQDKIWTDRFISAGNQMITHPHQNNGHPDLLKAYMNGKLHFCGTETSISHGGYMEGAVVSARNKALELAPAKAV
ncbi:monoamine oxidase [Daejeonella rubra]|uniref:Monoamine oxidase n=1 Tax=Daejeonella rubra TaxID=990371 RepID=A0A1G9XQG9_9SPHI|nr:NAD(P)/FAD-dependent oxidoreductase [Daejeonella rubra]SDM98435.1 monoamine oxidase [Daejeonella rubra]